MKQQKTTSPIPFLLLSGMLLLIGCTGDDPTDGTTTVSGNSSLKATIEETVQTRTTIDDRYRVLWSEEDAIGVWGNQDTRNAAFALSTAAATPSATFKGFLKEEEQPQKACYPYREENSLDGNRLNLLLPATYTYTGNSLAPMVAVRGEDGNFLFRHVTGLMRVILKDIPDGATRFVVTSEGTGAPALTGMAVVEEMAQASPVAVLNSQGGKQVVYRLPASPAGDELTFYIPLPAGSYPQLTFSLQQEDGQAFFTRTLSDVEARRAVILDVPVVNATTGGYYALASQAKEITEEESERISVLSSAEDGSTVLRYAGGEMSPQVGDVLIQGSSTCFPKGFLGKVTDIRQNGDGSCTVTTAPATLTDAFTDLYVDAPIDLVPLSTGTRAVGEISTERDEDGYRCFTIGVSDIDSENELISLEGSLTVGLRFIPTISLKGGTIQHAVLTLDSKMLADYTVSISGTFERERRIPIGKPIPLGSYSILQTPICITPELQFYAYIDVSGEVSLSLGLSYQKQAVSAFIRRNDQWTAATRFVEGEELNRPIHAEELTLRGEVAEGIGMGIAFKINHTSLVSVNIEANMGCRQTGDLSVEPLAAEQLYERYKDAYIENAIEIGAQGVISGELFGWEYAQPINQISATLAATRISLFPQIEEVQAEAGAENSVSVTSRVSGTVLSQGTSLEMQLYDEQRNLVRTSEPWVCGDAVSETASAEWNTQFENLGAGTYYACPVIRTSLVKDGNADIRPVYAKELAQKVDLNSDREVLVALYKSAEGEKWGNSTNWCTDRPLNEWYGVRTDNLGRVTHLYLSGRSDNLVGGTADLSRLSKLQLLDIRYMKLSELDLSGCKALQTLSLYGIQSLDMLDLSGCAALESFTESQCSFEVKNHFADNPLLKVLYVSKQIEAPSYTLDLSGHPALQRFGFTNLNANEGSDITIDVSGCTSLQTFGCGSYSKKDRVHPVWTGAIVNYCVAKLA